MGYLPHIQHEYGRHAAWSIWVYEESGFAGEYVTDVDGNRLRRGEYSVFATRDEALDAAEEYIRRAAANAAGADSAAP